MPWECVENKYSIVKILHEFKECPGWSFNNEINVNFKKYLISPQKCTLLVHYSKSSEAIGYRPKFSLLATFKLFTKHVNHD